MSTWYKTDTWRKDIKEVEVDKFTSKSVWTIGKGFCLHGEAKTVINRHNRVGTYDNYHRTWDDAHAYLLNRYTEKVARLKKQTHEANSILGKIKKMTKPV